eukprot:maker-scaffold711_size108467-snap-gene-0.27 protein:Tk04233 transcript:maker-scaffold711_size108467-snap-gene-0.27-mRNA-1 annotation:"chromosomal replication initiation protein"
MKFLIALFATVAAVCAEADPQFLYNGAYGYGIPQAYGGALTYAYGKSAPCVNAANLPVPCNTAYAPHGIYKREADPEADPAYLYGGVATPYAFPAYSPYAYNALPVHASRLGVCVNYVGNQVPC